MSSECLQAIALVSYGNLFLHTRAIVAAEDRLTAANSDFSATRTVRFVRQDDPPPGVPPGQIGESVAHWFGSLRAERARRLSLFVFRGPTELAPHIAAGFAGGVPVAIRVRGPREDTLWAGRWMMRRGSKWEVTYKATPFNERLAVRLPSMSTAWAELAQALTATEAFAARQGYANWAEWFGKALRILGARGGEGPPPTDLLPAHGYSPTARRLLAASRQAWVFGGMGSWNDLAFADRTTEEEYQAVTAALYVAVVHGLQASANAFRLANGYERG